MTDSPLGDPEALRRVAADLDRQAEALQIGAVASLARVDRMVWQAPPRSDRLRALYADRRRRADAVSGELHDLADALRRDAIVMEDRLAALRLVERKVRQAIDELLAARKPLPFATPFDPERLPPPGHPDWEKLGRLFGVR